MSLEGAWKVSERCQRCQRQVRLDQGKSGQVNIGQVGTDHEVFGSCLEGFLKMPQRCLEQVKSG